MIDKNLYGVRATIESLIDAGTTADISALKNIYHRDMQILMLDESGAVQRFDKPGFITMLEGSIGTTKADENRWADFHVVDETEAHGHVLITRKVTLGGQKKVLTLSIDLLREDDRWQVSREVIFVRDNLNP